MKPVLYASSATAGFFQEAPKLISLDAQGRDYISDTTLKRIAELYLPSATSTHTELAAYATRVIQPDIFALIADAERNPPSVSTHSTFGKPRTILHTSYGWRELQAFGIEAGTVAIPYENAPDASRMKQFLKYHIWSPSSGIVTCPSAMTDGAASLLRRHLSNKDLDPRQAAVFAEAYRRLTSRNSQEAWTSGQWMTERSGGSDVRGTETVATYTAAQNGEDAHNMPLGPWSVSGFKWFSSATDSQMTVLLAKTDKGGLSAFYAPMRRKAANGTIEMNGVSIQRLKPKMGTRALPTAELVIDGMRAWLIGKEGDGVREISAILNITRIHNAISALGFWGRALAISRAYAKVRKVGGAFLSENPAHVTALAKNTISYAAHMHLGFFVVKLLDVVERPGSLQSQRPAIQNLVKDAAEAKALLRLLTPVAKAQCSKQAIYGIQECMESLGGVGYIEDEQEFNIARLFRDVSVLSIWEGTTDVMADDVVRVIKGRDGQATCAALLEWVNAQTTAWNVDTKAHIDKALLDFSTIASGSAADMRHSGRSLLELLTWIIASVLLQQSASLSKESTAIETSRVWLSKRPIAASGGRPTISIEKAIVFGETQQNVAKL